MEWLGQFLSTSVTDKAVSRRQADAIWAFAATQPLMDSPLPPRDVEQMLYEWVVAGLISPSQAQVLGAQADDAPWQPPGAPEQPWRPAQTTSAASPQRHPPRLRTTTTPRARRPRLEFSRRDIHLAVVVGVAAYVLAVSTAVGGESTRSSLFFIAAMVGGAVVWRALLHAAALDDARADVRRTLAGDVLIGTTVCAALAFAELCEATGFLETRTTLSDLLGGGTYSQVDRSWVVFWTSLLTVPLSAIGMVRVFRRVFPISAVACLWVCSIVIDQKQGVGWSSGNHRTLGITSMVTSAVVLAFASLPHIPPGAQRFFLVAGSIGMVAAALFGLDL